jgi:hypothetical protein
MSPFVPSGRADDYVAKPFVLDQPEVANSNFEVSPRLPGRQALSAIRSHGLLRDGAFRAIARSCTRAPPLLDYLATPSAIS